MTNGVLILFCFEFIRLCLVQATWIGNANNSLPSDGLNSPQTGNHIKSRSSPASGLSPSFTSPAVEPLNGRKHRTDSLKVASDRFKGVQMNDGQILLKQSDAMKHSELDGKQLMKQFQRGFPDFEHLHQRFAHELANKIFDGHLKSYQRAFMPVTPQHLGLVHFTRHHRRSLVITSPRIQCLRLYHFCYLVHFVYFPLIFDIRESILYTF